MLLVCDCLFVVPKYAYFAAGLYVLEVVSLSATWDTGGSRQLCSGNLQLVPPGNKPKISNILQELHRESKMEDTILLSMSSPDLKKTSRHVASLHVDLTLFTLGALCLWWRASHAMPSRCITPLLACSRTPRPYAKRSDGRTYLF